MKRSGFRRKRDLQESEMRKRSGKGGGEEKLCGKQPKP
jgi:hypothetical protein